MILWVPNSMIRWNQRNRSGQPHVNTWKIQDQIIKRHVYELQGKGEWMAQRWRRRTTIRWILQQYSGKINLTSNYINLKSVLHQSINLTWDLPSIPWKTEWGFRRTVTGSISGNKNFGIFCPCNFRIVLQQCSETALRKRDVGSYNVDCFWPVSWVYFIWGRACTCVYRHPFNLFILHKYKSQIIPLDEIKENAKPHRMLEIMTATFISETKIAHDTQSLWSST